MSDISFLGLGLMGAAIATLLQQEGHDMTVWNRSPEKMLPFTENGARGASSLIDSITASPVVVICIEDYDNTRQLFNVDDISTHLRDRIIVQLSTGTPQDAVESEQWFTSRGARYLDGAILGGPANLATDNAQIIIAGAESAYAEAKPQLESMCKRVRYVGENIRAASALDLGCLSRHYGLFLGMTHGVAICESEGVSLDLLADMIPGTEYAHRYVKKIHDENFTETTATLST